MKRQFLSILLTVVIFALLISGMQTMNASTKANQKTSLEKALKRGIVECYALEGAYPESLDYLVKNYHVIYDHSAFDVKYEVIASNIMPTITVIEKD